MRHETMTDYNIAEIYDSPAARMTISEVFKYAGVDVIPFKGSTKLNGWGA
jgi:hypothetical protein